MLVPSMLKHDFIKHLILLFSLLSLAACSTQENFNDHGSTPASGISADMSLSWVAPVERDNGTGLSLSEIAGYRIYYGKSQGNYPNHIDINDGSVVHATLESLDSGTYYVVLTTIDTEGLESSYSSEIIKTI